ncbi:MAG: phage tail tip lysozyme [Candidatus Saccharimonas sp.]
MKRRLYQLSGYALVRRSLVLAVIFSLVLGVVRAQTVLAVIDEGFYSSNDILFYNPDACVQGNNSSSVSTGTPTKSIQEFVDKYVDYAYQVGKERSIPWEIILTEGGWESGWGASGLTVKANNFFGIKAGSSWTGKTITMPTKEFVNGTYITVMAPFRAYDSPKDSFNDYADFIHNNSRYAEALKYKNDPDGFIRAVAAAGYATDPNYAENIIRAKASVIAALGARYGTTYQKSSEMVYTNSTGPTSSSTATSSTPPAVGACQCPTAANTNNVGDGTLVGNTDAEKAFYYFTSQGISKEGAAGIIGNLMQETGGGTFTFHPEISNASGHTGIVQWDKNDRWPKLVAFAATKNMDPKTLALQLIYIVYELQTDRYKSIYPEIKNATDPQAAAKIVSDKYEIGGDTAIRLKYAQKAYDTFKNNSPGQTMNTSATVTSCSNGVTGSLGVYKNPYRDIKQLTPMRIDQGVDIGGEGPIYAIGDGVMHTILPNSAASGWPGIPGSWITYVLSDGPAKGKMVFFAENCVPTKDLKKGDKVNADTVICYLNGLVSAWSESGWAYETPGGGSRTAARVIGGGYIENQRTAMGQNFSDFLKQLGGPEGLGNNRPITGTIPADWPTWK